MRYLTRLSALILALCAGTVAVNAQEQARPADAGTSLETLRAGAAPAAPPALTQAERAAAASASAPALETLRATDLGLSDREVKIILITAAAVVLLAILV